MKPMLKKDIMQELKLQKIWNKTGKGRPADFSFKRLVKVNFAGENLDNANFQGAGLFEVNFSGARLNSANFFASNLTRVSFFSADLSYANFNSSSLTHVDFQNAWLINASLKTNLNGANFALANPSKQYIQVSGIGSRNRRTTYCVEDDIVYCGCFEGTLEEFKEQIKKTHRYNPNYRSQYLDIAKYFEKRRKMWKVN